MCKNSTDVLTIKKSHYLCESCVNAEFDGMTNEV